MSRVRSLGDGAHKFVTLLSKIQCAVGAEMKEYESKHSAHTVRKVLPTPTANHSMMLAFHAQRLYHEPHYAALFLKHKAMKPRAIKNLTSVFFSLTVAFVTYRSTEWARAQRKVRTWLRSSCGIISHAAGYYDPFDLITENGKRIEVKAAPYSNRLRGWEFNIHRHGKINESKVDVYVLRFEPGDASEFLGKNAFHLVIPSPISMFTVNITVRALMCGKWAKYFNNVEPFNGDTQ